jgi:hypothetical protein
MITRRKTLSRRSASCFLSPREHCFPLHLGRTVLNKCVSAARRTRADTFEDRNLRPMDRIVYWQPIQKQTCTTQSTDSDSVRPAEGLQRTVESTNHGLITFLPEHDVLLCTRCKVIVPSNDLDSHLRASHKGVRKSTRESIRETFTDVPEMRSTTDLQPLPNGSPPSSFLVPASTAQNVRYFAPFTNVRFVTTVSECSIKVYGYNTKPTEVQKNACYLQGWIIRRVV